MRNLILFFIMVVFMYLYSYILGGETSMVMVYMLLFSPVISIILIFPFKNRIDVSIDVPAFEVEKDGVVRVSVRLENKSFMPLPFINIKFCEAVNFRVSGTHNEIISLGPFKTRTITMEYTAISRGVGEIGVAGIYLKDYINLFRLSILKNSDQDRFTGEVTVLPRLVNLKPTSKILIGSSESLKKDDSGTSNINLFSLNGEPGYEFREYIPGDSLHKVHWKLSARNETLMVRKDEGRGTSKKRLFLDPSIKQLQEKKNIKSIYQLLFGLKPKDTKEDAYNIEDDVLLLEEKTLEAILALAHTSVKTGREVELWLFEKDKWNKYELGDGKAINEIQYRLASYKFINTLVSNASKRLPLNEIVENEGNNPYLKGDEATVFTGDFDKSVQKAIESLTEYGVVVHTVSINSFRSSNANEKDEDFSYRHGDSWVLGIDDNISEVFS